MFFKDHAYDKKYNDNRRKTTKRRIVGAVDTDMDLQGIQPMLEEERIDEDAVTPKKEEGLWTARKMVSAK